MQSRKNDRSTMLWAVTCESGKRYSQVSPEPFRISMASLEPRDQLPEKRKVCLMAEHDGKEFLLCVLEYDKVMSVPLNLRFSKGEETLFFVNGEGTVHLSGFILTKDKFEENEMDVYPGSFFGKVVHGERDEAETDDDNDDADSVTRNGLLPLDDSEDDSEDWTPEIEKKARSKGIKRAGNESSASSSSSDDEDDDEDDEDDDENSEMDEESDTEEIEEEKHVRKKQRTESMSSKSPVASTKVSSKVKEEKKKTPVAKAEEKKKNLAAKMVQETYSYKLSSGVEYEDIRVGSGPMAKPGKFVHVYYTGKLQDGKVFDSIKEGRDKPFAFRLGRNEVIRGWDEGVKGMRVGGKRKMKIPPKLGYGKKGCQEIPGNSTLYFTIELKAVN